MTRSRLTLTASAFVRAASEVIAVDKDNVKEAVIDSGYWPASDFTGLP